MTCFIVNKNVFFSLFFIKLFMYYTILFQIIALLIEGRRSTNHRRRPNTSSYSKVETDDGSTVFWWNLLPLVNCKNKISRRLSMLWCWVVVDWRISYNNNCWICNGIYINMLEKKTVMKTCIYKFYKFLGTFSFYFDINFKHYKLLILTL